MEKDKKERSRSRRDDGDDERRPKERKRRSRSDDDDDDDGSDRDRRDLKKRARNDDDDDDSSDRDRERRRRKKSSDRKKRRSSKHKRKKYSSDSESNSDGDSEEKKVVNERLLSKLQARGETLEERNERRAQKRAARIKTMFGYTTEDNPFNDPSLHEKFTWKKKDESKTKANKEQAKNAADYYDEIERVRQRRKRREEEREEMERIRREEDRMKELENYDEWARKEEEFHLQQQRQRSAIRLVEGREKPIDVLAKNLLLFGLSDEEKKNRSSVKYQEKYNAMEALETLDVELEEPQKLLKFLTLEELFECRVEIDAFRTLEREALSFVPGKSSDDNISSVLQYWDALALVVDDEIKFLQTSGANGAHAKMVSDVLKIFKGRSIPDLVKMKEEVNAKIKDGAGSLDFDSKYWQSVADQLEVYLAKVTLSDMHNKMLVRQLERLEKRREELALQPKNDKIDEEPEAFKDGINDVPSEDAPTPVEGGDLEDELGLTSEVDLVPKAYNWQHKYVPRRPRYFNRVKTGYDWNKYNQTHYDRDNPPPKTVQGYKFNVFYPDLVDPTKTPQYRLEPADSDEFCIIRFSAGAPYEDIAFKIVNREWNKSRKRGFKSTFERGVLSLYFNFTTHWYRR